MLTAPGSTCQGTSRMGQSDQSFGGETLQFCVRPHVRDRAKWDAKKAASF